MCLCFWLQNKSFLLKASDKTDVRFPINIVQPLNDVEFSMLSAFAPPVKWCWTLLKKTWLSSNLWSKVIQQFLFSGVKKKVFRFLWQARATMLNTCTCRKIGKLRNSTKFNRWSNAFNNVERWCNKMQSSFPQLIQHRITKLNDVNPFSPKIIIKILLTGLHRFSDWLLIGRTCLNIKRIRLWWSLAKFSWPICVTIHWYDEEKFDADHYWGCKD